VSRRLMTPRTTCARARADNTGWARARGGAVERGREREAARGREGERGGPRDTAVRWLRLYLTLPQVKHRMGMIMANRFRSWRGGGKERGGRARAARAPPTHRCRGVPLEAASPHTRTRARERDGGRGGGAGREEEEVEVEVVACRDVVEYAAGRVGKGRGGRREEGIDGGGGRGERAGARVAGVEQSPPSVFFVERWERGVLQVFESRRSFEEEEHGMKDEIASAREQAARTGRDDGHMAERLRRPPRAACPRDRAASSSSCFSSSKMPAPTHFTHILRVHAQQEHTHTHSTSTHARHSAKGQQVATNTRERERDRREPRAGRVSGGRRKKPIAPLSKKTQEMASPSAAAAPAPAATTSSPQDGYERIYQAVAAGKTEQEVRAEIKAAAQQGLARLTPPSTFCSRTAPTSTPETSSGVLP
jgi:hypothetical protein